MVQMFRPLTAEKPHSLWLLFIVGMFLATATAKPNIRSLSESGHSHSESHKCIHDQIEHRTVKTHLDYGDHPYMSSNPNRRLAEANVAPVRITPYFIVDDETSHTTIAPDYLAYLRFTILPEAIRKWQSALAVVPVQGNLTIERECNSYHPNMVCKQVAEPQLCSEVEIPSHFFGETTVCPEDCLGEKCVASKCTSIPGGPGVSESDYVVIVTVKSTPACDGSTLAYASSCRSDQWDRPFFGMINFCADRVESLVNLGQYDVKADVAVAFHELGHALGFSASHFAFMRNRDGSPRTPRDSNGFPIAQAKYTCANGVTINNMMAPDSSTVKNIEQNGHQVAVLTTPTVVFAAKQHFGCDSLEGVNLEDQDIGCFGSHWEERILETEVLSPMASHNEVLSVLTLAFFQDTGWYHVDFRAADTLFWGKKAGCDFIKKKCLSGSPTYPTPLDSRHFCSKSLNGNMGSSSSKGCTVDFTSKALCSIIDYQEEALNVRIPPYMQYFGDRLIGSPRYFADFCPSYEGSSLLDCRFEVNAASNTQGESYCPSCRCLKTSLSTGPTATPPSVGCYRTECDNGLESYKVGVTLSTGQRWNGTCTKDLQLQVPGLSGKLDCADPALICQGRTCPNDCSGRGRCMDGACTCDVGFEGVDCSTPICPAGCSDRGTCDVTSRTCSCYPCWSGDDCSRRTTSCPIITVASGMNSVAGSVVKLPTVGPNSPQASGTAATTSLVCASVSLLTTLLLGLLHWR